MGVRFACHGCGKALNIKTELAGKRGRCPSCGLRFRIPPGDQEFSIPLEDESTSTLDGAEESSASEPATHRASTAIAGEEEISASVVYDPLEDSQAQWYVRPPSGGRYGPADSATLRLWINEGRITPDTLLWRDGWAQWRSGDEVIPQWRKETKSQVRSTPAPPTIDSASSSRRPNQIVQPSPVVQPRPVVQAGPASQSAVSITSIASQETRGQEPYPSLKRRRKSSQRTIIVVCLIVSILLLVALIAVLMWPRQSVEETQGRIRPVSVACSAIAESIHEAVSKNCRLQ